MLPCAVGVLLAFNHDDSSLQLSSGTLDLLPMIWLFMNVLIVESIRFGDYEIKVVARGWFKESHTKW